ncbi:hypothetical protein NE237_005628 [Protea cynaroides]|uniref:Uncharacterized protein n=1 Tax=Protea cynaroides TaxID=273540 RepID=A0A9Q0KL32_9MAGN|nr:hypothetical protein NE237_005628 [Protea cynaroides]
MSTVVSILYYFLDQKQQKYVDPDTYGYLDVVYDVYNSVLRHIPIGKTVKFSLKYVIFENSKEMQISSDADVVTMFHLYRERQGEDEAINLFVHQVNVSDSSISEYTINGYPSYIVGRNESKGKEVDASMHPFINVADKKTVVSRPKSSSLSTGTRDVTSIHLTTNSIEMIGWGEESEGSVKELDEGEDDSLDVEWSKDSDIEANDGSDSESVKEVNEERDDDGGHSRDSLDEVDECQSDDVLRCIAITMTLMLMKR